MLRIITIWVTLVTTLLGSLGIPLSLHACRMTKSVSVATCGGCATSQRDGGLSGTSNREMRIAAVPCCSDTQIVRKLDPAQLKNSERSSVDNTPGHSLYAVAVPQHEGASYYYHRRHDSSAPPLARRGQATYLFNSCFRI